MYTIWKWKKMAIESLEFHCITPDVYLFCIQQEVRYLTVHQNTQKVKGNTFTKCNRQCSQINHRAWGVTPDRLFMYFNDHTVLFNSQKKTPMPFKILISYLLSSTLRVQIIIHKNHIFVSLTETVHTHSPYSVFLQYGKWRLENWGSCNRIRAVV